MVMTMSSSAIRSSIVNSPSSLVISDLRSSPYLSATCCSSSRMIFSRRGFDARVSFGDQVLDRELPFIARDLGSPFVAVLVGDLLQLVADDLQPARLRREDLLRRSGPRS